MPKTKAKSTSPKGDIHLEAHDQPGYDAAKKLFADSRKDPNSIGFLIATTGKSVQIHAHTLDQEFSIDRAIEIRDALSSAITTAKRNFLKGLLRALDGLSDVKAKN